MYCMATHTIVIVEICESTSIWGRSDFGLSVHLQRQSASIRHTQLTFADIGVVRWRHFDFTLDCNIFYRLQIQDTNQQLLVHVTTQQYWKCQESHKYVKRI